MYWSSETIKDIFPAYSKNTLKLNIIVPEDDNHQPFNKSMFTRNQSSEASPVSSDMLELTIQKSISPSKTYRHKSFNSFTATKDSNSNSQPQFHRAKSQPNPHTQPSKNSKIYVTNIKSEINSDWNVSPIPRSSVSNLSIIIDNFMNTLGSQGSPLSPPTASGVIDTFSSSKQSNQTNSRPKHVHSSTMQTRKKSIGNGGHSPQLCNGMVASPIITTTTSRPSSPLVVTSAGCPSPESPSGNSCVSEYKRIPLQDQSPQRESSGSRIQRRNLRAIRELEESGQSIEQLVNDLRQQHSARIASSMHHVYFMKKLFDSYELDSQKRMGFRHFRNFICSMFGSLTSEQYRALFAYFDTSHSGYISWNAFFWKVNKAP